VTKNLLSLGEQPVWVRAPLLILAIGAAAAGLYGRFKGLGTWPLGVDEFYISRSIDNILSSGVPRFSCGGYYTRGLAYQYLVAAMRIVGGTPEFDGRLIAAICSLAMLPAAYLVGRRFAGSQGALVCVILLAVSVWEIEMARFARMYAPFQAVFAWYTVCFINYVTEKKLATLYAMAALSLLGVLTWEGGVLLGVANILAVVLIHQQGRPSAASMRRIGALFILLVLLFLASRDLRGFAPPPSLAAPEDSAAVGGTAGAWLMPLAAHPLRACLLLLPLALLGASAPWIWSYRSRWLSAAALLAVAAAAIVHLFVLAAGALLIAQLAGLVRTRDCFRGRAIFFPLALLGLLIGWWIVLSPGTPWSRGAFGALFGFPDLYDEIVRPWGRTLPILSVGIAATLAYWIVQCCRDGYVQRDLAALLCLIVTLVLAVGGAGTDRLETRYTFFLYPILIILAVSALLRLAAYTRVPGSVALFLPMVCFAGTEDFAPRHIAQIDSAKVNFRVDMSLALKAHYYPRDDMRRAAQWLSQNTSSGDVVLTGIPNLAEYDARIDYFYMTLDDERYDTYACADGKTERWSNLQLLYGEEALQPLLHSGGRVFLAMYSDFAAGFESRNRARLTMTPVWNSPFGGSVIMTIASRREATEP
jgi:hypothetical protein